MKDVNIKLSSEELRLLCDKDFLITKRIITGKIYEQFADFSNVLKHSDIHQNFRFPERADSGTGKISRGENYKGLPYLILDFPRLFEHDNIFAFRTMLWWGNYFIFTLHLKGDSLNYFKTAILKNYSSLYNSGSYLSVNPNEWEHAINDTNYQLIDKFTPKEIKQEVNTKGFIKLSRKLNLDQFDHFKKFGKETYELFLAVLAN